MRLFQRLGTLRSSLLIIILLCWLLPTLILGAFMGTRISVTLQNKTESALGSQVKHALSSSVSNVEAVNILARNVVYDNEIYPAISAYQTGNLTYELSYQMIRSYLNRKFNREPNCSFAMFISVNDTANTIHTSQGYSAVLQFLRNHKHQALSLLETLDTHSRFVSFDDDVYLIRNLHNTRMERYGMLIIGLHMENVLYPVLSSAQQWDSTYAVSLDDYHYGSFLGEGLADGLIEAGGVLGYSQSAYAGDGMLRIQLQADKQVVYREIYTFRLLMVWLLVLLIPICIGIMFFVNRRIVRPITLLNEASDRIGKGELGVIVPMRGNDELGRLGATFSKMSLQIKDLIDKSYKGEIALRDARIQELQSRINPHFLNNALEIVNWQARMEGNQKVSEMVETLSILLNASMDRSNTHLVTLKEELFITDAYLYFITLQFGKKLTIERTVDHDLLNVQVPRMVIQTLIENAVEHGISISGGGYIELLVYSRNKELIIEVINNGKPLTQNDLARIRNLLDEDTLTTKHIGIRNINQRLKLIFGDLAGLSLSIGAKGETVATIRQPLQKS